jgi:hypothetical protein
MFRNTAPVAAPAEVERDCAHGHNADPVVPLSVLALDLDSAPAEGWASYLADHGIAIAFDDLGRRCISREDARKLLEQQRLHEIRKQDLMARAEERAIEADELRRSRMFRGIRADAVPAGMTAAEYMMVGDPDLGPRRPSAVASFLDGDEMVLHPIYEPMEDPS